MSDRLAVFNHGRIEQIGTPAQVYEQPASSFVAGFVGVSNVLEGAAARALTGSDGAVMIRPEKISMDEGSGALPSDAVAVQGTIATAVYLGASTRYVVVTDHGGELVVVRQNLEGSEGVLGAPGRRVRLAFERRAIHPVDRGHMGGSTDPEEGHA